MNKENFNNLTLEELRSIVQELDLAEEFDNIEAEYCANCCVILGGGGIGC